MPVTGPLEVRRFTPALRVFTLVMWFGSAGFLWWLSLTAPTSGHWIGDLMAAVFFVAGLYWLRAPTVEVRADEAGLTYVDTRRAWMMQFGEAHAAWTDVQRVETFRRSGRYGSYLVTRVTVRDEGGAGTRRFSITSRSKGYFEFLELLHTHTAGRNVEQVGAGDDPAVARDTLYRTSRPRTVAMVVLWLLVLGGFLLSFLTKRH